MAGVGCCSSRSVDGRDVPVVVLMAGVGCCSSRSANGRGGMLFQSQCRWQEASPVSPPFWGVGPESWTPATGGYPFPSSVPGVREAISFVR